MPRLRTSSRFVAADIGDKNADYPTSHVAHPAISIQPCNFLSWAVKGAWSDIRPQCFP